MCNQYLCWFTTLLVTIIFHTWAVMVPVEHSLNKLRLESYIKVYLLFAQELHVQSFTSRTNLRCRSRSLSHTESLHWREATRAMSANEVDDDNHLRMFFVSHFISLSDRKRWNRKKKESETVKKQKRSKKLQRDMENSNYTKCCKSFRYGLPTRLS